MYDGTVRVWTSRKPSALFLDCSSTVPVNVSGRRSNIPDEVTTISLVLDITSLILNVQQRLREYRTS
jgi:hypothetical protein